MYKVLKQKICDSSPKLKLFINMKNNYLFSRQKSKFLFVSLKSLFNQNFLLIITQFKRFKLNKIFCSTKKLKLQKKKFKTL